VRAAQELIKQKLLFANKYLQMAVILAGTPGLKLGSFMSKPTSPK
jgi:hypothetical protein